MFASFVDDGASATFGCKVAEEDFPAITGIEGIEPAAYAARYHWISIKDPKALPTTELLALLRGSYDLVLGKLPKKTQAVLAGATPAKKPATKKKKAPTK